MSVVTPAEFPADPTLPRPEPLPVVDTTDLKPDRSGIEVAMDIALRHGGVYIRRIRGYNIISASSLEAAAQLSDDNKFCKFLSPGQRMVRGFAGDGLFTAFNDEPNWAKAHDILLPAFSVNAMRRYHPAMLKVARRLVAAWDTSSEASRPVDVTDDMTRMTLETIGLTGFGYDFASFTRDEPHPFVSALVRCLAYCQAQELPRDGDVDRDAEAAAFEADCAYLASVVDEVIEARRAADEHHTDDLLGLMLEAPHPVTGEKLDPVNARHQVITFLAAGHQTTSAAVAFALYLLVNHPDVMRRAQAEVDGLWGDADQPDAGYEDVGRLTYIRQVLLESLRLWPPGTGIARQAKEDTMLLGRHPMKAGDQAVVLASVLHRDPKAWGDNPNAFDPDHFSPEREAARPAHAFMPFGTGERACIGRQFSLHEAVLALALLIHRYRFIDHEAYQLRIQQFMTIQPDGFRLKLARRTSADRIAPRPASELAPAAGAAAAAGAGLPHRVRADTALTVLYGSNLGVSRELAEQVAEHGAGLGFSTRVSPLDTFATAQLPREEPVVIVAASYNGRPTDDAAAFIARLEGAEAQGFATGVRYAVLGVGDRSWAATYQRIPTLIDDRLAAAGGRRLLERTEADAGVDLAGAVRRFTERLGQILLAEYGDPDSTAEPSADETPGCQVTELGEDRFAPLAERHGLAAMTVTAVGDLTDPAHPSARYKRFVQLELPAGTAYRTGDHLAVLPVNDPALVERAVKLLGADPRTLLAIRVGRRDRGTLPTDRPLTVRELLERYLELQDPATAEQITRLAQLNPCPPERQALADLVPGPAGVLDLIERFPALTGRIDWPTVLDLLPPMRTRYYSIASSPTVSPGRIDLIVSLLDEPHRRGAGRYRGAGSGYLSRATVGGTVSARVAPCREAFRCRHDVPAILVAAGTGLAPFRGAIADRGARRAAGQPLAPALCYFGCTDPDVDYLFADELRAADQSGVISMRPTFSRVPGQSQVYVQDRIAAEGDEVWQLLEDGAIVYVCGDAAGMAASVRRAFERLHSEHTDSAPEGSAQWLASLMAGGRYVEDVYTGQ